jgi:hypothetical protein
MSDKWIGIAVIATFVFLFGGMFAGMAYDRHLRQQCVAANNFRAASEIIALCGASRY